MARPEGGVVADDIVDRLRGLASAYVEGAVRGEVGREAADEIERLTAERDALRRQLHEVAKIARRCAEEHQTPLDDLAAALGEGEARAQT